MAMSGSDPILLVLPADRGTADEFAGPVNLGNTTEVSMRELAERVIDITGSKSSLVIEPLPVDDPRQRCPDTALAASVFVAMLIGQIPADCFLTRHQTFPIKVSRPALVECESFSRPKRSCTMNLSGSSKAAIPCLAKVARPVAQQHEQ
jgi:hypothetical protein